MLLALLLAAAITAVAAEPPDRAGRDLATAIARKIRCAPRLPGPCWRDPLTEAYGRTIAGAVRALAPTPLVERGLLPVDFRYCRSVNCALPGSALGLTASKRRVTAFVSVDPGAAATTIAYWHYRPTLGWARAVRYASPEEVSRFASTPLLESDVPRLVALETLPGRNHYRFSPSEEPPWRWRIPASAAE